jgi:hypothetical protein
MPRREHPAGRPTATGPGFRTAAAYVSDNPGYEPDVTPAKPLKDVVAEVGEGC